MLKRIRYQVFVGLFIGVALPAIARQFFFDVPFYFSTQIFTILGGALALVLGYIGYRRMLLFPGIASGGYAITSMTITFSVLLFIFVVFRLDYSRLQLLSCYALSTATLLYIHLKVERRRSLVLAYLPGGLANDLPTVPHVRWYEIQTPTSELNGVNAVVVDLHIDHDDIWETAIARWVLAGLPVYDARSAREQLTGKVEINHLYENTLGSLNPNNVLLKSKSVLDFFVATLLVIIGSFIFVIISIIIRLDSPGPAIFRQIRIGYRAQPFTVYKFRTMYAFDESSATQSEIESAMTKDGDVRVTRFGRILRKSRLDELPQLFNIILGQMSLIGPRPEATSLSNWYESKIPFYHYRHIIKPGLTGWAQVNQGHVTNVADVRKKLDLDFYYVKNYSVWLDLLILMRTVAIMITGQGAR